MTIRSVIISFFIISIAIGMTVINSLNTDYKLATGHKFIDYDRSSYVELGDLGVPTNEEEYRGNVKNMTDYQEQNGVVQNFDFFQNIKYGGMIIDLLMNCTVGFPSFLVNFGMPTFLVTPIFIWVIINHILAVIYIVTGRTFIY